MIYLAIAMIFVGLVCFLYLAFPEGFWTEKPPSTPEMGYRRDRSSRIPSASRGSGVATTPPAYFQARYPHIPQDSSYEDILRRERAIKETPQFPSASPDFVESVTVTGNVPPTATEEAKPEVERLRISGFLYLDHLRQFPYEKSPAHQDVLQEDWVKGLKRIGKGELVAMEDDLVFSVKNLRSFYPADELEQVVFYDQGFALIPKDKDLPIPLFFTEGTETFREFLASSRFS